MLFILFLELADHVIFHNRFVSTQLLLQYLSMADIYVTPYPRKEQITSGTLSYAVGAGKAVVSTPYWHAEELLADGRGVLVDFENPDALAQAIIWLLDNEFERNAIRKRAYNYSRHMVWEKVSLQYVNLGEEIAQQHASRPKPIRPRDPVDKLEDLPAPNLLHMRVLTDDNGILQHAYYTIPDRNHGYSLDDNARALIVSCLYYKQCPDDQFIPLIQTYLSFLHYAFNPGIGRFRNFMSYHRIWLEQCGSEDSHSRALWGLGVAVKTSPTESIRDVSARIFRDAIHACETFTSIRALAYAVVGCNAYLEVYSGDSIVRRIRNEISMRIFDAFKKYATEDWPWFEDKVTYANGIIPLALMLAGQWIPNLEMHAMGVKSLRWLLKIQTAEEGHLSVIGNQQWLTKGGIRAKFDQSPLEPMCLILACCQAYLSMQDPTWISEAQRCLDWYLGRNDLNLCLVSFKTGGCSNGLNPEGISPHQGAEATLSWLISLLSVRELISRQPPSGPSGA
ncbi:MAG: glycosyltransferase [Candidatus Bathyarchaeia archaeon]